MQKTILIVAITTFLLLQFTITAQNAFELSISTLNEDASLRMIQNSEGNFILVGTKYNDYYQPTEINGYIAEINTKGEIEREKNITLDDTLIGLYDILENNKGGYHVFGAVGNIDTGYTDKYAFFEFDKEFNILKKHYYSIPINRKMPGGFAFKNSDNNYIIFGSVRSSKPETYGIFPVLLEISETGAFIREKYLIDTETISGDPIFDIIEKKDHSGYFVITRRFPKSTDGLSGRVLNLDKNFNLQSHINIPKRVHNAGTIKWFTDTSFILSGTKTLDWSKKTTKDINAQDNDIAIMILDTLGNLINSTYIGKPDTTDFPGFFFNFDYVADSSSIYVVGTQGFVFSSFPNTKSKIILTKLDRDLNVIWEKFYGGDAYYIVYSVQTTNDNGCIIISARYNPDKPEYQDDIHILKVDFHGNIIASVEDEPTINVSELILYPNPGTSELKIRTAKQSVGGIFYLYDISGKQILQKQITDINTSINTLILQKGIYIYKYIYKNKMLESGKWIKN